MSAHSALNRPAVYMGVTNRQEKTCNLYSLCLSSSHPEMGCLHQTQYLEVLYLHIKDSLEEPNMYNTYFKNEVPHLGSSYLH